MKKKNIIIVVLGVLLLIAVLYIEAISVRYSNKQKLETAFQQGAQIGYQQAIEQLMEQMATCQPVPVFANNVTLNAIATECLQQV